MVVLEYLLLALFATITYISFAEEWFIGELAASLRVYWLWAGVLLAVFYGIRRKYLLLLASWALVLYHAPVIVSLALEQKPVSMKNPDSQKVRIYQHNTLRYKDNADRVVNWLKQEAEHYDIVFLQEVSPKLNDRIATLSQEFPYIIPAYFDRRFDNAILSRFPISSFEIRTFPDLEIGYIRCEFTVPGAAQKLVMYGMHATAPISPAYWHARNGQFYHIAKEIAQEGDILVFLVGDLNLTPYSSIFNSLMEEANLRNSMKGFGMQNTWGSFLPLRIFGIPIDHLLYSERMQVLDKKVGPNLGSDHYSVMTTLALPSR